MAFRQTMPSNGTNLFIAKEVSPGVLPSEDDTPGTNIWLKLEPNSYDDFGAELELVARQPLSEDRQQKKGVIVGADTSGGFNNDFTATAAIKEALSGFFYSDPRNTRSADATGVTATGYTVASGGDSFRQGDLILVTGSPVSANNGVKSVGSGSTSTEIKVSGLTLDAGPVDITTVGFSFASGDAVLDTLAGELPAITTTAKDMTQLGLIAGQFVYLGGDGANDRFTGANNSGWCRVKSVTANRLVFDKTDYEMTDDAGTGKTIKLYIGDIVKNETGTDIKRKTYRLERSLGRPDMDNPNSPQADYLKNSCCNELTLNMGEKEIMSIDFGFIAGEYGVLKTTDGLFSGTREVLQEMDAYNTSGDIKMERLAVYPPSGSNTSAPVPLFALIQETSISINNNAVGINAHRFIGYVEITEGMFEFSGELTAYFATVEAIDAVQKNSDTTYAVASYKNNAGFALDIPLVTLGNGMLELEPNEPIRIPLDLQASTGAKYDKNMNHTGLITIFNYLPTFASRRVN